MDASSLDKAIPSFNGAALQLGVRNEVSTTDVAKAVRYLAIGTTANAPSSPSTYPTVLIVSSARGLRRSGEGGAHPSGAGGGLERSSPGS